MNTTHFFRQVSADQFTGSMAYLESQQTLFHSDQTSGMIEIQIDQARMHHLAVCQGQYRWNISFEWSDLSAHFISEIHSILDRFECILHHPGSPGCGRAAYLATIGIADAKPIPGTEYRRMGSVDKCA